LSGFLNNEYNDIFMNNYKILDGDLLACLQYKVNFKSLVENYKLPLDLIETFSGYFNLEQILTYQILTIEEIVRIFKIYEIDVKKVDKYEYYLFIHQLPTIDKDIIDRIKMMLELTDNI